MVFPSRIFVAGRRCSDVRAPATSTLFGYHIMKLWWPPPTSPYGTSGSATQGTQSSPLFCEIFSFNVIRLTLMSAPLVKWANMRACHSIIPLASLIFLSNFYIQMFGHPPFTVIQALNTMLCSLMTSHTTCGRFHFVKNQRCYPPFVPSSSMSTLNFVSPS